jgi:hypothetical protein
MIDFVRQPDERFLAMLSAIKRQDRKAFCKVNANDREELVADAVAQSFVAYPPQPACAWPFCFGLLSCSHHIFFQIVHMGQPGARHLTFSHVRSPTLTRLSRQ